MVDLDKLLVLGVHSPHNTADILTKPLGHTDFECLCHYLSLCSPCVLWGGVYAPHMSCTMHTPHEEELTEFTLHARRSPWGGVDGVCAPCQEEYIFIPLSVYFSVFFIALLYFSLLIFIQLYMAVPLWCREGVLMPGLWSHHHVISTWYIVSYIYLCFERFSYY